MPGQGVEVQHSGWDAPCAQVTVAGRGGGRRSCWAVAELGCQRDPPHTHVHTSPWHMFTSTCQRGEQDEATGAVWVCMSAGYVCLPSLPPPRTLGYTCACWEPTFSLTTGWVQGQQDPARLPQQGRQRLAGAASRVLAPGRQLPGRVMLSSPEYCGSDSMPAPTLCSTGRWEQGAVRRRSRVRRHTA